MTAQHAASSAKPSGNRMQAELLSSDVLTDLRAALATFEDEARSALDSVLGKSNATLRWADEDAPYYWQSSQRKANEQKAAARVALDLCKLKTVAGHRPSCIEEKVALRRAKEREQFCTDQRSRTRGTANELRHTVEELTARLSVLQRWLDGDLPRLQARLHQTAVAVDAYTATPPVAAAKPANASRATSDEGKADDGATVGERPTNGGPS